MQFLEGPATAITALAFSPDGTALAIGGRDGSLSLFENERLPIGELANDPIHALSFDPSGVRLVFGGAAGWFGGTRRPDGQWNILVPKDAAPTAALAFLDDDILAVGSGDRMKAKPGMLELRNLATGRRLEPRFHEPTGVRALAAHPATRTVAWTSAGQRLSVWSTQTLEPRTFGLAHAAPALAFHPEGERLAIAQEWTIAIHDVRTFDLAIALKGHTGRVTALAYSPDGRHLATASWDKTVRIWNADGQLQATFDWGIGRIASLAFAPDGLRLAAGGEAGTVAIIDVE